jgi:hypothetical protein
MEFVDSSFRERKDRNLVVAETLVILSSASMAMKVALPGGSREDSWLYRTFW